MEDDLPKDPPADTSDEDSKTPSGSDGPRSPEDPVRAAATTQYLAQLQTLELYTAEQRRKASATARNKAATALLKGRWGGPIVLAAIGVVALIVVGLFALGGADLSVAVDLADSVVTLVRGCEVDHGVAP